MPIWIVESEISMPIQIYIHILWQFIKCLTTSHECCNLEWLMALFISRGWLIYMLLEGHLFIGTCAQQANRKKNANDWFESKPKLFKN